MILTIFIAFISIIGLLVLHELGHFLLAKAFNTRVDEFGIGYPPRIFGKKFGETIYSINWLPFGAFVRLPGEIEKVEDPRAFSNQSLLKRVLIIFGGVLSFWIMASIIFSIVMIMGAPTAISDDEVGLINPKVQIALVDKNSPAEIAGLKVGDTIKSILISEKENLIEKVSQFQKITNENKGKEITLKIESNGKTLDVKITPRLNPPSGQGPLGIALTRTAIKSYPWYKAIYMGPETSFNVSILIIKGLFTAISNAFHGLPTGVQMTGPVGIGNMLFQATKLGANYYLNFLAMITVYLAIFNLIPIPSVDGGKLLFLSIEAIRRKPISAQIEQKITVTVFSFLLLIMLFVTVKDIINLF